MGAAALVVDLLAPAAVADPYPLLAVLRAEDPVHWSERHGGWLLTRYDDVLAAFGDPRLSSERIRGASEDPVVELLRNWMVFRDPPSHTRMRGPFRATFTPRSIEALGSHIERVVSDLLDGLADEDAVDLVSAFAFPLPAIVIAELLGVSAADRDRFHAWSVDLAALVMVGEAPDRRARAAHGVAGLAAYLRAHLDSLPPEFEAARAELSEDEIVATAVLLLFAGHETTTSLIANGVWTLLQRPAEVARLRANESLMPIAVDELLRYEGPTKAMARRARDDLELRGRRIRAGDSVFLMVAAANRDPAAFPDPDRFDVGRSPNRHLTFGHGIHFCLGAPLARIEARIALRALLERCPTLTLADGEPQWAPALLGRALTALPIELGERQRSAC